MCSKSKFNVIVFNQVQKKPPDVFSKKRCSEKFHKFYRKHLCWSLFLKKLQAFRAATLLKRLQYSCFSVKFAKLLRAPILKNICERLLLPFHATGISLPLRCVNKL